MSEKKLEKQLDQIRKKETKLYLDKSNLKYKIAKLHYAKLTYSDLKKAWNSESDYGKRYELIEKNPDVERHFEKLAGYGGLSLAEIEAEVLRRKFDESEWLNVHELFDDYLKEDPNEE